MRQSLARIELPGCEGRKDVRAGGPGWRMRRSLIGEGRDIWVVGMLGYKVYM